jgi:hypothetical protein
MNTRLTSLRFVLMPALPLLAPLALSGPANGQWSEGPKIHASDGVDESFFGGSTAISGDLMVIGAEQDDELGSNAGAAYVYRRTGNAWNEEAKLLASDGSEGEAFGSAVAVGGDFVVVAASLNGELGPAAGAVYVFRRNGATWEEQAKLTAADGDAGDRFGISLAASGDAMLVGAYTDETEGTNAGAAYVFRYNGSTWAQESKITPNDAVSNLFFGFSAALDGNVAVVGATGDNDNGTDAGAAYVFRRVGSSWIQQDKLLAADGDYFDGFGFSVDVSGGLAIVGAFADVVNGAYTGSAYVFRNNGTDDWVQETKLLAADLGHGDLFGQSVAVGGDVAMVGADREDDNGTDSGAVYVFRFVGTHWVQQSKLMASDGSSHDNFGRAVALSGTTAVVGAWKDDDMGSESGAAYVVSGIGLIGEKAGDRFGRTAANVGDVDGDGVDDVLLGAPFNDQAGASAGKVYLVSGATRAVIRGHVGESAGDRFGEAVGAAGDVDDDGTPDYIVGAPFRSGKKGAVYVFSGDDGSQLLKITGSAAERLGSSVAGGYDYDADGHDDLLVGAPYNGEAGSKAGKAYLFSGATGATIAAWTGESSKDRLGHAVATLGRTNNDPYPDLAFSAPWNDEGAGNAGKVYVVSGADFSVLYGLTGAGSGDQFGRSLAAAGRVDGDNRTDLVVGSPLYDKSNASNAGRVDLFSGVSGERIWAKVGQRAGDRLGWAVAAAGDVNGDDVPDVIAAAPWNDIAGSNRGRIYVRSGVNGGSLAVYDGETNGDLCGYAVAGAGDLDGNGLDDLWIGAPHHDLPASNAGRLYPRLAQPGSATAPGETDVDGDGLVDEGDVLAVLLQLGLCPGDDSACAEDVNDDGGIDLGDLLEVIRDWN